jgi:hypothetical protein
MPKLFINGIVTTVFEFETLVLAIQQGMGTPKSSSGAQKRPSLGNLES